MCLRMLWIALERHDITCISVAIGVARQVGHRLAGFADNRDAVRFKGNLGVVVSDDLAGAHAEADSETETPLPARRCPCCGGRMIIIEMFEGPRPTRSSAPTRIWIDTS